jgi:hypothetical protein
MPDISDMDRSDQTRGPVEPAPDDAAFAHVPQASDDLAEQPSPAPDAVYQPLSLVAVLGFGLAVTYAAVMAVVAVVALVNGSSMFWTIAVFLIPLLILGVAGAGWFVVQRSEGTRSGGKLARAGIVLTLVVTLLYAAYYAGVYVAVRGQATDCADKFLAELEDDDVDQAFRLTLPPDERPSAQTKGRELHIDLEQRFNITDEGKARGPFTQFARNPLVLFLRQGGKDTRAELVSMTLPEYTKGERGKSGYVVKCTYRFTAPVGTCFGNFTLMGSEGGKTGKGRREWHVSEYQLVNEERGIQWTDLGRNVETLRKTSSQPFAAAWLKRVRGSDRFAAYLETLYPEGRADAALNTLLASLRDFPGLAPLLPEASVASAVPIVETSLGDAYTNFSTGQFLTIDEDRFPQMRPPEAQEMLVSVARQTLVTPVAQEQEAQKFRVDPQSSFRWYRTGEHDEILHLEHDVEFGVLLTPPSMPPDSEGKPRTMTSVVQGSIALEGNALVLGDPSRDPQWRVVGLRVIRARMIGNSGGNSAMGGNRPPGRR